MDLSLEEKIQQRKNRISELRKKRAHASNIALNTHDKSQTGGTKEQTHLESGISTTVTVDDPSTLAVPEYRTHNNDILQPLAREVQDDIFDVLQTRAKQAQDPNNESVQYSKKIRKETLPFQLEIQPYLTMVEERTKEIQHMIIQNENLKNTTQNS